MPSRGKEIPRRTSEEELRYIKEKIESLRIPPPSRETPYSPPIDYNLYNQSDQRAMAWFETLEYYKRRGEVLKSPENDFVRLKRYDTSKCEYILYYFGEDKEILNVIHAFAVPQNWAYAFLYQYSPEEPVLLPKEEFESAFIYAASYPLVDKIVMGRENPSLLVLEKYQPDRHRVALHFIQHGPEELSFYENFGPSLFIPQFTAPYEIIIAPRAIRGFVCAPATPGIMELNESFINGNLPADKLIGQVFYFNQ